MENFGEWIATELKKMNWKQADLSRSSGLDSAVISNLINGKRGPGEDTCRSIASAFRLPPETVFRAAGILPPLPPEEAEWEVWRDKLRQLSKPERERFLRQIELELEYQKQQEQLNDTRQNRKPGPLPGTGA
jgi:transcriptional regulator with XRE-family HTH domain